MTRNISPKNQLSTPNPTKIIIEAQLESTWNSPEYLASPRNPVIYSTPYASTGLFPFLLLQKPPQPNVSPPQLL
jgi:hypothetical protein